jgi:NAD(P)-dependent dehydrogenase (short-subunit alcohol dehydrogenase family)
VPTGALVTGGAGGIGKAIAARLAARGGMVFVADVDHAAAAGVADDLVAGGHRARALALDVTRVDEVSARIAEADREAPLAAVVNNAGIAWSRPLVEVTPDEFDRLMSINLRGAFFVLQAAARAMIPRGHGSIVNIASTSAFTASTSPMVPYDTSKGGLRTMTVSAARELARHGIRVNAIAPGTVDTPLTRAVVPDPEALGRQAADRIPLGRLGVPEDVAAAVEFLVSDDSAYITGHVLVVDGGWLT